MPERADMQGAAVSEGRPARKRWPLVLLALGLLLLAAGIGLWAWQALQPGDGMEPNVVVGPMGDYSPEEIEAMLAQKVEEGMIAFSINTQVAMESPGAEAPLLFENPGNNAKLLKMELVRDDTGETLYESGFLAPGTYVGKDELDVELEPGSYACTATISAYREDTRAPLGQAAAEVVLTVLDGSSQ